MMLVILWVPSTAALPSLQTTCGSPAKQQHWLCCSPGNQNTCPLPLSPPPLWPQACSSVLQSSHSYQLPAECLAHLIQLVFGARHQMQRGALSCEGLCDRLQAQLLSPRGVTTTLMMPMTQPAASCPTLCRRL